jgi:uncharacterized protein DUF1194
VRSLCIFLVLPLAPAILVAPVAGQTSIVDLELVMAVDVSFSMNREEQRIQRGGYVAAFQDPLVIGAILAGSLGRIAVTYVEWGGSSVQTVPWTLIDSQQSATAFAKQLSDQPLRRMPFTSISDTIAFARDLIRSNAFHANRRVIDISGDGPNNYGAPAPVARNAAILEGIVIDGLPIMLARPSNVPAIVDIDAYYHHCVIGGDGAFLIRVRSLGEFAEAIRKKLVTEITGLILSDLPQDGMHSVKYHPASAYNCFVGEELLEHPQQ